MILLTHNGKTIVNVTNLNEENAVIPINEKKISVSLFEVAKLFPNEIIIWCNEAHKDNLNIKGILESFHLQNIMVSYACSEKNYFPEQIGYVEDTSPFIKVNKQVKYPTWIMSSQIGAIYGTALLKFKGQISLNNSFDYVLNSIAKLGIAKGLFCYSNPNLINKKTIDEVNEQSSIVTLFKFVKQHYKYSWIIMLFINYFRHEKKIPLRALINALFYSKVRFQNNFKIETVNFSKIENESPSIDVIIPTIGRKKYLYNVLEDLSKQTLKPQKVIIVEQDPVQNSKTELNYIESKTWPFKIIHKFIHQTGACNARNLALKEVTADYVYLADDDNEFHNDLLHNVINTLETYKLGCITMSYLQKDEKETQNEPIQWYTFGAGSSVLKSEYLKSVAFNMVLEHGYGEDVDFGMQLRNIGVDVIYFPNIKILHLKAPVGGFRTTIEHIWSNDSIQPKPSPTVMFNRLNNTTEHQLLGYQTRLLIEYYKYQNIKNPLRYFKVFLKQWQRSKYWANELKNNNKN
ncbi:glycosyltransferase family 2 protein [Flavivirga eckloniae]|uniref:Glycosyltransferase family 2 protein n=1 Tax=Flavivirga eckloniae TaxID=1803846 RepID=A0A2K9PMV3_9FLAO|nr:glycosyltransferase family A protein [Flavivirga eckloniae]AUP78168.1 glycosyltransferase family 2 protein [Flavivirga eckloniae]